MVSQGCVPPFPVKLTTIVIIAQIVIQTLHGDASVRVALSPTLPLLQDSVALTLPKLCISCAVLLRLLTIMQAQRVVQWYGQCAT